VFYFVILRRKSANDVFRELPELIKPTITSNVSGQVNELIESEINHVVQLPVVELFSSVSVKF
jgi:hypothetical protein